MKNKSKLLMVCILLFLIVSFIFLFPYIRPSINDVLHQEFIEQVKEEALSANINIVRLEYSIEDNGSFVVLDGASGVIIEKDGHTYYALTALHILDSSNDATTSFNVMGYNEQDFVDQIKTSGEHQGMQHYYEQLPEATIEHTDNMYDLAIIRFVTKKNYSVLPISSEAPQYGDLVAAMGNQNGKRNMISTGKISSRKPSKFGDEDGKSQYPIIKHTAFLSAGSSGSAVLNENLELVGINLGGNENLFHTFLSGMAMPSDRIHSFIDEWKMSR